MDREGVRHFVGRVHQLVAEGHVPADAVRATLLENESPLSRPLTERTRQRFSERVKLASQEVARLTYSERRTRALKASENLKANTWGLQRGPRVEKKPEPPPPRPVSPEPRASVSGWTWTWAGGWQRTGPDAMQAARDGYLKAASALPGVAPDSKRIDTTPAKPGQPDDSLRFAEAAHAHMRQRGQSTDAKDPDYAANYKAALLEVTK